MGPTRFLILALAFTLASADDDVTVETIKHEDDIAYLTPDHHPDVDFSDHFDHPVKKLSIRIFHRAGTGSDFSGSGFGFWTRVGLSLIIT